MRSPGVQRIILILSRYSEVTVRSILLLPHLVGTDKTLGILPGGSGNGLIRNLHISLSWRQALDTLIHGRDKYIDIGKINNSYFFNVAGDRA